MNKSLKLASLFYLSTIFSVRAQLTISLAPLKVSGTKAVVPLQLKNNFPENIESARATVFVLDEKGKAVAHTTRWIVGGAKDRPALESNKEATFNFVLNSNAPLTTTNLMVRISCSRIELAGGKLADPIKDVQIQNSK